ncbi:hypothetical protein BM221_006430 [Beauveria bassiana]|uniref:Uncharacterized protein n=1 Tax=Beauveria bassiana TaxID=176275 RepID=A0A2N6NLU6_BEABA|nr:hypothetical protein BM221_006430 [Beauveria bassiana]
MDSATRDRGRVEELCTGEARGQKHYWAESIFSALLIMLDSAVQHGGRTFAVRSRRQRSEKVRDAASARINSTP